MPLHSSLNAPTKRQQARHAAIREDGCLLCRLSGMDDIYPAEIHHLLSGGRKISHDHVLGLCLHHHRQPDIVLEAKGYGPSLAGGSATFQMYWGVDADLLKLQCEQIGWPVPDSKPSKLLPRAA